MKGGYWEKMTRSRLSRRRTLAGTGGLGLSAIALGLVGCGDDNSGSGGGEQTNSLVDVPVDTTSQAKGGGTLKDVYTAELTHMDALASNSASTVNNISVFTYPRLVKFTAVPRGEVNDGSMVEGDLMESFELSGDKLTLTLKLRQGLKWDPRAPTSGRVIDTEDVLFSWKKFAAINPSAPNLVYDATKSPGAPVESFTAPDNRTIVMKLRQPDGALLPLLAGWDQFYTMPRESEGGFDPRSDARGYGPWLLEEFRPSAYTYWRKNPDYYVKDRPFFDRLERTLVPEFATRLSQFKAGNIHTDVVQNSQQDVIQLKRDVPQTLLRQQQTFQGTTSPNIIFGYEGNSIFKDVRMRQAMSMSIDREAFADAIENRESFARDGLPVEVAMNSMLSAGWPDFWMDPQDEKAFGPNAKYLQYNPTEAKKLIAAAGHANGADFDFFFNKENTYGATYARMVEIYAAMFQEVGLRPTLEGQPYAQWLANWQYGYIPAAFAAGTVKGFSGAGLSAERARFTPALSLYGVLHSEGDAFHGATPTGNEAVKGDPKLNDILGKARQELDRDKAIDLVQEAIRYTTQQAYMIPKPSNPKFFTIWWPAIGNQGTYESSVVGPNIWAETRLNWWLDTTKPPFRT